MTINEALRLIAGTFVLLSVLAGYYLSPWFFVFTGFIGLNLMQSAFTRRCPMISLLRAAGLKDDVKPGCCP